MATLTKAINMWRLGPFLNPLPLSPFMLHCADQQKRLTFSRVVSYKILLAYHSNMCPLNHSYNPHKLYGRENNLGLQPW